MFVLKDGMCLWKVLKLLILNKMKNIYYINNKKNDLDSFRNGLLEMNWKLFIFVGFRFDVVYEGNNYYRDNYKI